MNAAAWIAAASLATTLAGGGLIAVSKLTRIAVAVEQLVGQMGKVIKSLEDHDQRLRNGGL